MRDIFRLLMGAVILAGAIFAGVFLGLIVMGVLAALMVVGAILRWRLMRAVKSEVRMRPAQDGPRPIEGEYRVVRAEAIEILAPETSKHTRQS